MQTMLMLWPLLAWRSQQSGVSKIMDMKHMFEKATSFSFNPAQQVERVQLAGMFWRHKNYQPAAQQLERVQCGVYGRDVCE